MKKLFLFAFVALMASAAVHAEASLYKLDNEAMDLLFEQAVEADYLAMNTMTPLASGSSSHAFVTADKNPAVAFILAWFVGYLGIHRAYLGTSTGTIIAYILTLGGCGIVAFVDWVVLLIGLVNDDITKYVDNPSFFMW